MANINGPERTTIQSVEVPVVAPKVSPALIVQTLVYLVAIINAGAALFGFDFNIEADQDFLYEGVTLAFTAGTFIMGVWKNHNYTKEARIKEEAAKQVEVPK